MIKKGKSELSAKREILAKYEIPEAHIDSAFSSYDAPKEVALNWAKQELKLDFKEEYLRDILTDARKIWRFRGKGIIGEQTLKECPKVQLILVDINFELGMRYYAVMSISKEKMEKLKYVPVAQSRFGRNSINLNECINEELLVLMTQ